MNKKTKLSKIKKMNKKIEEINEIFQSLDYQTQEELNWEFRSDCTPDFLIRQLQTVLEDCLDIVTQRV